MVLHIHGNLYEAINCYKEALKLTPGKCNLHFIIGNRFKDMGNMDMAAVNYKNAVKIKPYFSEALNNLGAALQHEGKHTDAAEIFEQAYKLRPNDPTAKIHYGSCLIQLGKPDEAILLFDGNSGLTADKEDEYHLLGNAYEEKFNFKKAIKYYKQLIQINQDHQDALASLGSLYERQNKTDQSRVLCNKVLYRNPDHYLANLVMAKIERRSGDIESARERLELLLSGKLELVQRANVLIQLGHALAWTYTQKNNNYLESILAKEKYISGYKENTWHKYSADDGLRSPVFLVGFPRSGTTLTEQILATHTRIITGDELPIISTLIDEYSSSFVAKGAEPAVLDNLEPELIGNMHKRHWDLATSYLEEDHGDRLFIDKLPMNIIHIPLIHRLFSDAIILVAIRDPRDVCLSCFMQSFTLNNAMVYFTDIQETARLYAATMDFWVKCKSTFSLDYIETKYEDLVSNTRETSQQIFQHIGLTWEESVLEYYKNDNLRLVSTPSYQDILSPIYCRSLQRWKNYKQNIETIQPILTHLIEEFSYN